MKRIKWNLLTIVLLLSAGLTVTAQDCEVFFPMEEGSVREMTSYDKKDKVTGKTIQTVKEVERTGELIEILVEAELYDEKEEFITKQNLMMSCEEGIFKFDMRNYFDQSAMAGMEGFEVTMDATDLEVPSDLEAGDELKDGSISVEASTGGVTLFRINVQIYDRKVEAQESITTSAGTFECYKLTYTTETKAMVKVITKGVEWLAPNIGVVRSETYNKNGKLTDYMVLTDFR